MLLVLWYIAGTMYEAWEGAVSHLLAAGPSALLPALLQSPHIA